MAGKAYVISICVFRSRNSYNIEKYYFELVLQRLKIFHENLLFVYLPVMMAFAMTFSSN